MHGLCLHHPLTCRHTLLPIAIPTQNFWISLRTVSESWPNFITPNSIGSIYSFSCALQMFVLQQVLWKLKWSYYLPIHDEAPSQSVKCVLKRNSRRSQVHVVYTYNIMCGWCTWNLPVCLHNCHVKFLSCLFTCIYTCMYVWQSHINQSRYIHLSSTNTFAMSIYYGVAHRIKLHCIVTHINFCIQILEESRSYGTMGPGLLQVYLMYMI